MKKMYYIPGIFSIILLPVLGIWYLNTHGYFTKLSAHNFAEIDFAEIDFAEIERMNKEYEFAIVGNNEFENRAYTEVTLNGNYEDPQNAFNYIDQFVNEVIQTKDTIDSRKLS